MERDKEIGSNWGPTLRSSSSTKSIRFSFHESSFLSSFFFNYPLHVHVRKRFDDFTFWYVKREIILQYEFLRNVPSLNREETINKNNYELYNFQKGYKNWKLIKLKFDEILKRSIKISITSINLVRNALKKIGRGRKGTKSFREGEGGERARTGGLSARGNEFPPLFRPVIIGTRERCARRVCRWLVATWRWLRTAREAKRENMRAIIRATVSSWSSRMEWQAGILSCAAFPQTKLSNSVSKEELEELLSNSVGFRLRFENNSSR